VKQTGQVSECQLIQRFRILIVSAVKICQHSLHTASVSGDFVPALDRTGGLPSLDSLGYSAPNEHSWGHPPLIITSIV